MEAIRRFSVENIVNCRDLGGYICHGGVTRYGRVLRCGVPRNPSESDLSLLRKFGVKSVIDLRGDTEADEMPSAFPGEGFDYYRFSLFDANPAMLGETNEMSDLYLFCIRECGNGVYNALSLIARLNGSFMVHCFLGKDRTGMLCALLLAAAGVSREDIIADYVMSEVYLKPFYMHEIGNGTGLLWEADVAKLGSPPKNIERALDFIENEFGGIRGYFDAIGLTAEEQEAISRILK